MKKLKTYESCAICGFDIIVNHLRDLLLNDKHKECQSMRLFVDELSQSEVTELLGCLYYFEHYIIRYKKYESRNKNETI